MKSIGIVRKVDELGRIVIPKELRNIHGIDKETPLEIFIDGDNIILKVYCPECVFCGEADGVVSYKGKNVCKNCAAELAGIAK